MDIQKERPIFDAWHYHDWRSNISSNIDESAYPEWYHRIYSHFSAHHERELQFKTWLAAKAQAVPEGCIITPKLSANYLFNKVPELGFLHQDEKDTVLYHLNYMACGFNDSAKQFVVNDHEVQKQLIEDEANTKNRTDFEIINQTITLVDLLASSTNRFQRDQERCKYPFESENPRVKEWWCTACRIQELLTGTDPENCDFEEYKTMIEAAEGKSL